MSQPSYAEARHDVPTVRRPKIERRYVGHVTFELVVIEGPGAGTRAKIDGTEHGCLMVGSGPTCGLAIDDEEVAPRQCSLRVLDGRLHLLDLASTTTQVNGVLTREASLAGGELIRVGESVIAVHRHEEQSGVIPRLCNFGRVYGASSAMRDVFGVISRILHEPRPILVEGEAGVGKQLLAEEMHAHTVGQEAPFVALSERGLSSERIVQLLFGSASAATRHAGLVDEARGGTLFIEEVRDLDADGQRRLAAVIVAATCEPAPRRVRFVLASRRTGQESAIATELMAVIGESQVVLPPLRKRDGDTVGLARRFWTELGGQGTLPDDLMARFVGHAFPGNVRELRIAVQDRVVHGHESAPDSQPASGGPGHVHDDALARILEANLPFVASRNSVMSEFEKRYVDRALERSSQSVAKAAQASGIAHRYFQMLKSRYRTA